MTGLPQSRVCVCVFVCGCIPVVSYWLLWCGHIIVFTHIVQLVKRKCSSLYMLIFKTLHTCTPEYLLVADICITHQFGGLYRGINYSLYDHLVKRCG